jgi:hypothetical protein
MKYTRAIAIVLGAFLGVGMPAVAHAQHHHGGDLPAGDDPQRSFGVGIALIAASFDTELYAGDYQAVAPTVRWANKRVAVSASLPVYRLQENGLPRYGAGDTVINAQGTVLRDEKFAGGVSLGASLPTGEQMTGLGMGHAMLMPSLWSTYQIGTVTLNATFGYCGGIGEAEHAHGMMWPIVEPMNLHEVAWSVGGDLRLAHSLRAGARLLAAHPIGDGSTRIIGGIRATWTEGRLESGFEIQAGFAGDPFTLRGVAETTVSF